METRKFAPGFTRKSMMFFSVILVSIFGLTSCYSLETTALKVDADERDLQGIPFQASFVVIEKEGGSAKDLFYDIKRSLDFKGHELDMISEEMTMLTTRGKVVDVDRVKQRMEIRVRDTAFGARAVISTQHRLIGRPAGSQFSTWRRSYWDAVLMRTAFAETVVVAKSIPGATVSYEHIDPFAFWDNHVPRVQTTNVF